MCAFNTNLMKMKRHSVHNAISEARCLKKWFSNKNVTRPFQVGLLISYNCFPSLTNHTYFLSGYEKT
jgi:hypothetical protein